MRRRVASEPMPTPMAQKRRILSIVPAAKGAPVEVPKCYTKRGPVAWAPHPIAFRLSVANPTQIAHISMQDARGGTGEGLRWPEKQHADRRRSQKRM